MPFSEMMPESPATGYSPLLTLVAWVEEARGRGAPEPESMALATASPAGAPSVRTMLCRGIDGRGLRFFTNYEGRKGRELEANPQAAVLFFWAVLDRQVRVEGRVERLPATESDEYFHQRPRGHQLGAWASAQSRPLASVEYLREESHRAEARYQGAEIPRPAYWGGFLLRPSAVELWVRGSDRLHERIRYEPSSVGWNAARLFP